MLVKGTKTAVRSNYSVGVIPKRTRGGRYIVIDGTRLTGYTDKEIRELQLRTAGLLVGMHNLDPKEGLTSDERQQCLEIFEAFGIQDKVYLEGEEEPDHFFEDEDPFEEEPVEAASKMTQKTTRPEDEYNFDVVPKTPEDVERARLHAIHQKCKDCGTCSCNPLIMQIQKQQCIECRRAEKKAKDEEEMSQRSHKSSH